MDRNKLWKILKEIEYQTILLASWETCMQVKRQQLELEMEQWTVSKLGKEPVKAENGHPAYLTYTQSSVHFSHSVVSKSLWPHGWQHFRLPCPSPTPGAYSNSCSSSWWCHPTISSSVDDPLLRHAKCWARWSTAGIKISQRYINNLRYADDLTFMAENKEELNSLLIKVKEESEKMA